MGSLSLKTKMTLVVSLLVAGVLSGMTLTVLCYLDNQYRATVSRQQFHMVSLVAEQLDRTIRMTQGQLVAVARTITFEDLATPRRAEHFLRAHPDELETFDNGLFLLSGSGKLLASYSPDPGLIGTDFSYRDYFKQTLATARPVISAPFQRGRGQKSLVVIFTVPVFDRTGKMIAVLAGSLDLKKDNYLGKLAQAKVGEHGYFCLLNSDRTIIVHPDRSKILERDLPPGVNPLLDAALNRFEATGETVDSRGTRLLTSYKRLHSVNWILSANYVYDVAYAPFHQAKWYLLSALCGALLCTLAVSWFFMRHLTAPLVTFIRHVERITGGEQEPEPIVIDTRDEIGTLAFAFNRMVEVAHRQKQAVLAQEAFSESLLQNSSVATFVLDCQHRVIIWNRACEELTGVPASHVVGTDQAWSAFYPGRRPLLADLVMDGSVEDVIRLYSSYTKSPLTQDGLYDESWHVSLGGKKRFLCCDAAPIRNAEGEIVAAIETLHDLTERKLAEESLEKFSLAMEQMPATVVITDRDGVIEYVNPNFTKVTGYSAEEAIGEKPKLLRSDWHSNEFFTELWETILAGKVWRGEMRNRSKDGNFYWESASISPVKGPSGEVMHFVAVKEDITERKLAEEALREATAAAQAATKAKSAFLAGMSHEIRTPMNAVLGMLYLLQQSHLDEQQKGYLDKAQTASTMLLRLINDILDFSKIEAGKLELERVPFRLAALLHDLATVTAATIRNKAIELQVSSAPDVPELLMGDPLRLGQILLNLTSNAVKFTEQGRIEVRVSCASECNGELRLQFSVADTGIGMAPEQQASLFNAFTQGDSSTTRKYGGTGLGLAISKSLVEVMGGTIWATSELGKGSTFSFAVPLQRQDAEQNAGCREGAPPSDESSPKESLFAGMRLLLVEDDPFHLELATALLERRGIQVDQARNGQEALRRIGEPGAVFDAVLMDVHMPVLDGLETTRRMRQEQGYAEVPILAMTTGILPRERALCIEAGMNDQIDKPIDVNKLFATLGRWVTVCQADAGAPSEQADTAAAFGVVDLPGLDLQRALVTVESMPLLKKLLSSFARENSGTVEELLQSLSQGDLQGARRFAHTVKGVAGNLGAYELAAAAASLETALRRETPPESGHPELEAFQQKLAEVLRSIGLMEQQEQTAAAPAANKVGDPERVAELARGLYALLEVQNLNALGVWAELRPLLSGAAAQRLDEKLGGLDFGDASRLLDNIMQGLGISRPESKVGDADQE